MQEISEEVTRAAGEEETKQYSVGDFVLSKDVMGSGTYYRTRYAMNRGNGPHDEKPVIIKQYDASKIQDEKERFLQSSLVSQAAKLQLE